jgi:hypothetical protein
VVIGVFGDLFALITVDHPCENIEMNDDRDCRNVTLG